MSEQTDRIAHEAARLIAVDGFDDVALAIRAAAAALGLENAPPPGDGRVRQHLAAMTMQAEGEAAYRAGRRRVFEGVESLMTTIEETVDSAATRLVGRAARGRLDGPGAIHVRVYARASIRDIVATLVDQGYEEPDFETADTRLGRCDRIRFTDDGCEFVVTRILPEHLKSANVNLFNGRPVETLDVAGVRRLMS